MNSIEQRDSNGNEHIILTIAIVSHHILRHILTSSLLTKSCITDLFGFRAASPAANLTSSPGGGMELLSELAPTAIHEEDYEEAAGNLPIGKYFVQSHPLN